MIKATLDTNAISKKAIKLIEDAVSKCDIQLLTTTVSEREVANTDIEIPSSPLVETGVWDESVWGKSKFGGTLSETLVVGDSQIGKTIIASSGDRLEYILSIITSGSFPKPGQRENLTHNERNQLRDAMILDTHLREKNDIFVSNDKKAFVGKDGKKRDKLEEVFKTKIMTVDEFCKYCELCGK